MIFWRILKNQTVVGPHLLPYSERNTMDVNGDHQLITSILQNIFYVQQKKETHAGMEPSWEPLTYTSPI